VAQGATKFRYYTAKQTLHQSTKDLHEDLSKKKKEGVLGTRLLHKGERERGGTRTNVNEKQRPYESQSHLEAGGGE